MHLERTHSVLTPVRNGYRRVSNPIPSQICCDIAKLALLQLRLPEDRICVLSDRLVQS